MTPLSSLRPSASNNVEEKRYLDEDHLDNTELMILRIITVQWGWLRWQWQDTSKSFHHSWRHWEASRSCRSLKNAYFRKLQSNISVSPTSRPVRSWYIKGEVSYFLGRKILRAYSIQTLPSSDLPGGSKFSPSGTGTTRVSKGLNQRRNIV